MRRGEKSKSAMVLTAATSARLARWRTPDSTRVVASTESTYDEVFVVGMRFIARLFGNGGVDSVNT